MKGQTWKQTLNALSFLPNGQLWGGIKETHYYPTRIFVPDFNRDFSLPFDPLLAAWEIRQSPNGYCMGDIALTRNSHKDSNCGDSG